MTNTHLVALISIAKAPNQKVARRPKYFSFFFFFFFFFFRRASSNLSDFHDGFRTKQQHFSLSSAQAGPSLFSKLEVTQGDSIRLLKNYGFLYDAIFLHMYACTQIT